MRASNKKLQVSGQRSVYGRKGAGRPQGRPRRLVGRDHWSSKESVLPPVTCATCASDKVRLQSRSISACPYITITYILLYRRPRAFRPFPQMTVRGHRLQASHFCQQRVAQHCRSTMSTCQQWDAGTFCRYSTSGI